MAKRTASAKKQARSGVRRAVRNRAVRSEVKTKVVKARKSLSEAPVAEAEKYALALEAVRSLDRAASKGVLHRNNAARRKARLTRQLAKLGIAAAGASAAASAASGGKGKKAPAVAPAAAAKSGASKKK
jgi:small subunit ribosomal protein S20